MSRLTHVSLQEGKTGDRRRGRRTIAHLPIPQSYSGTDVETKLRSHSLSSSVLELYTLSTLFLKMDTPGIESMDERNPLKILEFFMDVYLVIRIKGPNNGYQEYGTGVLKDWVKKKRSVRSLPRRQHRT